MTTVPSLNQVEEKKLSLYTPKEAAPKTPPALDPILLAAYALLDSMNQSNATAMTVAKGLQANADLQQSLINSCARISFRMPTIYYYTHKQDVVNVEHSKWAPDGTGQATKIVYYTQKVVGPEITERLTLAASKLNLNLGVASDFNQVAEAEQSNFTNMILLTRQNAQVGSTSLNTSTNGSQQSEQIFGSLTSALLQLSQAIGGMSK